MIKIFIINFCFISLSLSVYAQQDENRFRIQDIFGTYKFVSYNDEWADEGHTTVKQGSDPKMLEWIRSARCDTLVIAPDFYIFFLGEKIPIDTYEIVKKANEKGEGNRHMIAEHPFFPRPGYYILSELRDWFPQYPRKYDFVIAFSGGYAWAIEIIDIDTVIMNIHSMYLLFKKVSK
jgi:hypothetical protein